MDDKQLIATVKQDVSWIQRHERIIIIILVLAAAVFAFNKYIDHAAKVADEQAAVSSQILKEQQNINQQLIQRMDAQDARYASLVEELTKKNEASRQEINTRNQDLAKQQSVNNTLPLVDLAGRWKTLINALNSDVQAFGPNIMVSDSGARQTVNKLEETTTLEANLTSQTNISNNLQKLLTECNQVVTNKQEVIDGKDNELKKQKDDSEKQIVKVKADDRRSKRNWFVRGMIAGGGIAAYILLRY